MGVCGSKEKGCVRVGIGSRKKRHGDRGDGEAAPRVNGRRRRRLGRKKANAGANRYSFRSKVDPSADVCNSMDRSARHGSTEWFDTATGIESDGDDEFYSIQDDVISQSSSVSASVTPRISDHVIGSSFSTSDSLMKPNEQLQSVNTHGTTAVYDINNCLPCLTCTTSADIKSKSSCSSPPSAKKKKVPTATLR